MWVFWGLKGWHFCSGWCMKHGGLHCCCHCMRLWWALPCLTSLVAVQAFAAWNVSVLSELDMNWRPLSAQLIPPEERTACGTLSEAGFLPLLPSLPLCFPTPLRAAKWQPETFADFRKREMETNYKGKFLRGWEFGSEDWSILLWLQGIKRWSLLKLGRLRSQTFPCQHGCLAQLCSCITADISLLIFRFSLKRKFPEHLLLLAEDIYTRMRVQS